MANFKVFILKYLLIYRLDQDRYHSTFKKKLRKLFISTCYFQQLFLKIKMLEYPITHPSSSLHHHHHYTPIPATSSGSLSDEDQRQKTTSNYRLIRRRIDEDEDDDYREGAESATSNTVLLMADTITGLLTQVYVLCSSD
ncbi:hypothetical protein CRE_05877 [Caenorhabditis remanei]|uniref:Uncharacterized protein n=1 Tax=Caenorhabditis remanei TaxID=31234 RepID=E3MNJ0_CAERE|nr:hypothetical protein CRE_05877 [Caenorhabditis remanei]